MAYAHDLRCPTNPFRPEYTGFCERCSAKVFHAELRFQHDFRGNALANLNVLVCSRCEDVPQEQLRPIIIGPDGLPPRPRPTPNFYQQQMAGTGSTAPPTVGLQQPSLLPSAQLAVLGDNELV